MDGEFEGCGLSPLFGSGYVIGAGVCSFFFWPFRWDDGVLSLALEPVLPGSWFTTEPQTVTWRGCDVAIPASSFACAFLGHTLLVYHNPTSADTFGACAVKPASWQLDDTRVSSGIVTGKHAEAIRQGAFRSIVVELG